MKGSVTPSLSAENLLKRRLSSEFKISKLRMQNWTQKHRKKTPTNFTVPKNTNIYILKKS